MSVNPYAVSVSPQQAGLSELAGYVEGCCPLCGLDQHMTKSKPLYNTHVCKKCYYKFANRRQLAYVIDNLVFRLALVPLAVLVAYTGTPSGQPISTNAQLAIDMLPYLVFPLFAMKDGFAGYSLGKLICGVRLINIGTGVPGGFGMSFLRNLPIFVPIVPLIIAYQLQKGRRWGDGWSSSKVIWVKYKDHPIFAPLAAI
jgi:uncharacterized RDD family membrane protein YckC